MSAINFSKWRERFWPIHSFELKKVLPLFLMKFLISFIYVILASLKDTIIVTSKNSGAEVIPVLKASLVLPSAFIVTLLYVKLSNLFKRTTLFNGLILFFLFFFLLYAFYLYPNAEALSLNGTADYLQTKFGQSNSHIFAVIRYWMHSLFFVGAELWGSVGIFLLFWGFVNQFTQITEAKRYYGLFIAGGNLASISCGPVVWHFLYKNTSINYLTAMQNFVMLLCFAGLLIMAIHYYLTKYVLNNKKNYENQILPVEQKTKLSLWESIKLLYHSKYLRNIAMMVICYGIIMNLVEVTWKAKLQVLFPSPAAYQTFTSTITSVMGFVSFILALIAGSSIIRFFGWRFTAMIPPIVVGGSGLIFLIFSKYESLIPFVSASSLLIIGLGAMQNILSKSVKYTFFDPTKEISFIPLDQESKVKGKAAIDVVGARLGKSGGAWMQLLIMEIFATGSILSVTQYIIPLVALFFVLWIYAVNGVHKEFSKFEEKQPEKSVLA